MKSLSRVLAIFSVSALVFAVLPVAQASPISTQKVAKVVCPTPATNKTWDISFVSDLSGPLSRFGTSQLGGLQTWVTQVNKTGGVACQKVNILIRDDKSDVLNGLNAYKAAISEKPFIIMGPFVSTLTAVAAPLAQQAGINTFMWSAVAALMKPPQDRLYSTAVTLDQMAVIQAKVISQLSNGKAGLKVFMTRLDSAAGVDFSNAAKTEISKRGWELMGEQKITASATNVSDQAAAMAASGAEYCLCATFGATNVQLMRTLRSNGSKMIVVNYFGGGYASDLIALKDPNYYAVLNYVDPISRDLAAAGVMRVRAQAANQTKYMTGYPFTQGYVAGMIFTQTLTTCGPLCTPDLFRTALKNSTYDLGDLAGPTSLDKSQYLIQSGRAFKFQKGKVISVGDWQTAN